LLASSLGFATLVAVFTSSLRVALLVGSLVALVSAAGCWGTDTSPFPPGLEPAAPMNEASFPVGTATDPYPETLSTVRTYATYATGSPPSVHGRGYVHAPLAVVWAALRNPDVGADRRAFASYTVMNDVEPGYDYSYAIHAIIQNLITFGYTTTFRHGVIEGTLDAPVTIAEAWQKTEGSTIIAELRGSVIAHAITPEVTSLEMIQYSRTAMSNHADNENYLREVYAAVVALSHGLPLPAP
jgi:hypothetical protein